MFDLTQYETVDQRLEKFWVKYPDGAIITEMVAHKDDRFIFKASIYKTFADSLPFATGFAEEIVSGRGVNSTSACENAESSAIGRALHTGGISKHSEGKPRPSAEEMNKVVAASKVKANIDEVKAKMAQTATEYVPVAKADDPWTIAPAQPVQTLENAVEMVKSALGGTPVDESCIHGPRIWKTGTSKAGKQWGHWKCNVSRQNFTDEPCDPIWYEISADGTWKPQVKR
jgi:hypothetical protein